MFKWLKTLLAKLTGLPVGRQVKGKDAVKTRRYRKGR